jgi:hypothetical protein
MRRRKKIIIIDSVIIAIILLGGIWLWLWSRNIVTIENASGKMVKTVALSICGRSYSVENLAPGATKGLSFTVDRDSGVEFKVSFMDGSEISGNGGYITGGAGVYRNRILIRVEAKRVKLEQY